jgi:hypothetical protein
VTNGGSTALNPWTLAWTWAGDQKVTSAWNAAVTQSGTAVTATGSGWNGSIPAGGSVSFGFQGSYTTGNPTPARFTLNGSTCGSG